jgi:hypothetical protein
MGDGPSGLLAHGLDRGAEDMDQEIAGQRLIR